MTQHEANALSGRLASLIGQKAWGVAVGHGSFLTLELGAVVTKRDAKKPHGEWHLWLYMTAWRIDGADRIVSGSEDDRARMESAARILDGRTLTAVEVIAPSGDLTLSFGPALLRTFAVEAESEQWLLYTPTGTVVQVGVDGSWSERAADATV